MPGLSCVATNYDIVAETNNLERSAFRHKLGEEGGGGGANRGLGGVGRVSFQFGITHRLP